MSFIILIYFVRSKIGNSRVDLQSTLPPPYSPPLHGKPVAPHETMTGNIPFKS